MVIVLFTLLIFGLAALGAAAMVSAVTLVVVARTRAGRNLADAVAAPASRARRRAVTIGHGH